MTDRPILFSAPMVRALLDGRKTQTRRALNPQPYANVGGFRKVFFEPPYYEAQDLIGNPHESAFPQGKYFVTPYPKIPFAVGDRLWVKETWHAEAAYDDTKPSQIPSDACNVLYAANSEWSDRDPMNSAGKTRVSIFMPRWASRLTLTVTDVRVQRLQECDGNDAISEGVAEYPCDGPYRGPNATYWTADKSSSDSLSRVDPVSAYSALWNGINGQGAWEANPWVVAISFTIERRNIDG